MSFNIVFMGTPDFAVPSLKILVENNYKVVGVITATDKFGGRGKKKLLQSAVKKYAVSQHIPVLQPKNLKDPEFLQALKELKPDLNVVVAFRMLPEQVWDLPKHGTINLHGSLLPKYRGAAPINWAVINGEKETGVTSFKIQHEIDTGDVIIQEKMPIGLNDTAGDVHDRMMLLGAEVVLKTVKAIETGNYELKKQNDQVATKAPKIFRETCQINFDQSAKKIHNFIRGLSPYPAAWTTIQGQQLKILKTKLTTETPHLPPGVFQITEQYQLLVGTSTTPLEIIALQLQGRKKMQTIDFLNGYSSVITSANIADH